MIRVVYLYDVVPGKAEEAKRWALEKWVPFWLGQSEISEYQVFTNYFGPQGGVPIGSPQRMVTFDVGSVDSLEKVMSLPEFQEHARVLQQYAVNVKFMIFRRSYPPMQSNQQTV